MIKTTLNRLMVSVTMKKAAYLLTLKISYNAEKADN